MRPLATEKGALMPGHGRASVGDMNRVEIAILLRVSRDENTVDGCTHLTGAELSRAIGVSGYRTKAAVMRLVESGELESRPCFNEDGGQLANALAITDLGKRRLDTLLGPC